MLHLFARTQQHATWDKANLLLLQQKIPFNGDYAPGTIFLSWASSTCRVENCVTNNGDDVLTWQRIRFNGFA
jgi:hypothetical protein